MEWTETPTQTGRLFKPAAWWSNVRPLQSHFLTGLHITEPIKLYCMCAGLESSLHSLRYSDLLWQAVILKLDLVCGCIYHINVFFLKSWLLTQHRALDLSLSLIRCYNRWSPHNKCSRSCFAAFLSCSHIYPAGQAAWWTLISAVARSAKSRHQHRGLRCILLILFFLQSSSGNDWEVILQEG